MAGSSRFQGLIVSIASACLMSGVALSGCGGDAFQASDVVDAVTDLATGQDVECKVCGDGYILLESKETPGEQICVDPKTDVHHCGATASYEGVPCNDDQYCDKGQCKVCNVVEGRIGLCTTSKSVRTCSELSSSNACGACGRVCAAGEDCWASGDKFACYPKSDIDNCGGIGNACLKNAKNAKNARCVADLCQYDCKPGYADAQKDSKDARQLDGCETSVQTTENCGGIGIKCGVAPNTINECYVNLDGGDDAYVGCKCKIGFVDADRDPQNGCEADCVFPRTSCKSPNICDTVLGTEEACSACNAPCQVSYAEQSYIALKTCRSVDNSYDTLKCTASECTEGYYTENYTPDIEASELCQTPCATTHSNCANSLNECATNLGLMNLYTCKTCETGFGNCDNSWENGCETRFVLMNLNAACDVCSEGYVNCDNVWANGCEANFIKDNLKACQVCSEGYGNCDNNWTNGCEVRLALLNLEACGVCNSEYGNCDGKWENGCETKLNTVSECGSCKTKYDCPTNFTCGNQKCTKL